MKKLLAKIKGKKKGFTLVELIVVIAIIAILAAILVPTLTKYIGKSKQTAVDANAKSIYTAASAAATDVIVNGDKLKTVDITDFTTDLRDGGTGTAITIGDYMDTVPDITQSGDSLTVEIGTDGVTKVTLVDNGKTGIYPEP